MVLAPFIGPRRELIIVEDTDPIAIIICKLYDHRGQTYRGYIGMLAVKQGYRKRGLGEYCSDLIIRLSCGIGSLLVKKAIARMKKLGAEEVCSRQRVDHGFDSCIGCAGGRDLEPRSFKLVSKPWLHQGKAARQVLSRGPRRVSAQTRAVSDRVQK